MISAATHWLDDLCSRFWLWVELRAIQDLRDQADLCDDLNRQMLTIDHEYIQNCWKAANLRQRADERERAL